jgi:uncharacterized protein (TIGR02118 family)
MAAKLLVLYNTPADAAAFDAHYTGIHAPLVKQWPGLRTYTLNAGPVETPAGPAPYHAIADLTFDSLAALQAALQSPEGTAALADIANFGQAGVTVLMFETRDA